MPGTMVLHFAAWRMRIVGTGNMRTKMLGYNNILTKTCQPLLMQATNKREPVKLVNFKSEVGRLRGETTEINEYFKINSITLYVKDLWSQYAQ